MMNYFFIHLKLWDLIIMAKITFPKYLISFNLKKFGLYLNYN